MFIHITAAAANASCSKLMILFIFYCSLIFFQVFLWFWPFISLGVILLIWFFVIRSRLTAFNFIPITSICFFHVFFFRKTRRNSLVHSNGCHYVIVRTVFTKLIVDNLMSSMLSVVILGGYRSNGIELSNFSHSKPYFK